ncbi:hypothetical protein LINPERPRIM_LOCUS24978 [Linum perenne]
MPIHSPGTPPPPI